MPRGNPHLKDMPHRGRKPKSSELFYFIINDDYRVSKDTYQYVISQRNVLDTGKAYEVGIRYYNTLDILAEDGLSKLVSKEEVDKFIIRVKDIKQKYVNGKMIVSLPDGVMFDPRDVPPEETEEEDAEEETVTDTKDS